MATPTEPDPAYVALALTDHVGPARLASLLAVFGSAAAVLRASPSQLAAVHNLGSAAANALAGRTEDEGVRVLKQAQAAGASVLVPGAPAFPPALGDIPDPPPILFAQGDLSLLDAPGVGLVGSRDHTHYGERVMRRLASSCARCGINVVSGLARGLDAVAHEAALDVDGPTVAVLGSGIGVVYPRSNERLYQRIRDRGCILTEFGPMVRPNRGSFPRRNRLISGLSRISVVVEAGSTSGALITADAALNQGRDVGAVPGPIDAPGSVGPNRLIQAGAKPVLGPDDVLEEFGITRSGGNKPRLTHLAEAERSILQMLGKKRRTVDDLALALGTPSATLLTTLTALEIRGFVSHGVDGWQLTPSDN